MQSLTSEYIFLCRCNFCSTEVANSQCCEALLRAERLIHATILNLNLDCLYVFAFSVYIITSTPALFFAH